MTHFGDWLKAERARRNLSQDAAADFIGVARGAYGKVERGGTIRPNNWEKYADKFGRPRAEVDALINADAEVEGKPSKMGRRRAKWS